MDGTELWIRRPGSPEARRLFVGRLEGREGPVLALRTDAGFRVLAVLLGDEEEAELTELLAELPEAALDLRASQGD